MVSITANDLKTKGVSVLEDALLEDGEAVITVRGKETYVVIDMKQYSKLREYELEVALLEARADVAAGRVKDKSVEAHMKRITGK